MTIGPQLEGATAIVTGGGTGIGAALVERLVAHGAHVIIAYRSSEKDARDLAEKCRASGGAATPVKADVAKDEDCRKLAQAAGGRIDVLVNNAGMTREVPIDDLESLHADDFRQIYDVNVIGPFQMIRAARSGLEKASAETNRPAAILNVSSIAGVRGRGSSLAYVASKAALNGMTLSLARALAPKIRVNAICPGYVASGWWEDEKREALSTYFSNVTPLKAASTPEDIADAGLALCLPATRHVTGETLLIDAGMHLMMGPEG